MVRLSFASSSLFLGILEPKISYSGEFLKLTITSGNNRNTDSSGDRNKDKKKEQPGSNVGHSVISTHKTSDKGNHMAYALE